MPDTRSIGAAGADQPGWNAIVLAGGRASRLGGIDKTALSFRGRTLLEHALASAVAADATVVVGPALGPAHAEYVREPDRHGGPAAAVVAGLAALGGRHREWTALIAADQPHVAAAMPLVLGAREVFADADGIVPRDSAARMQTLLAVYRTAALLEAADRARRRAPLHGMPLRELLRPLDLRAVLLAPHLSADVDTPEDARALGIDIAALRLEVLNAG